MNALPQAIAPNPHINLLNVYVHIANKMGFQPKEMGSRWDPDIKTGRLNIVHNLTLTSAAASHAVIGQSFRKAAIGHSFRGVVIWRAPDSTDLDKRRYFQMESAL
jgi:hypothetical protein